MERAREQQGRGVGGMSTRASPSATTLHGPWLVIARVAWVIIATLALGLFLASIPGLSNSILVIRPLLARPHHAVRVGVVDRRVHLRAKQYHRCREIEVEEQTHGGSQTPVGDAVVCEVCQVEGETNRRYGPQNHSQHRPRDHCPKALLHVRTKTVD